MEQKEQNKDAESSTEFTPSAKLNFVIAVCAMLVSVASFYATYLQANSAEQQVKAMTYPLIQFSTGNFNSERNESSIYFNLSNEGVGPAIVKTVSINYNGQSFDSYYKYLDACCNAEWRAFREANRTSKLPIEAQLITLNAAGTILKAGGVTALTTLNLRDENSQLWNVLNRERRDLTLNVCYCSLLEKCYSTTSAGNVQEVQQCITPKQSTK